VSLLASSYKHTNGTKKVLAVKVIIYFWTWNLAQKNKVKWFLVLGEKKKLNDQMS
jgi:hypothetical protein